MDSFDVKYKLIRADFMVAKSHLEMMKKKIEKAAKENMKLTKSHIVRQALDSYFLNDSDLLKKTPPDVSNQL